METAEEPLRQACGHSSAQVELMSRQSRQGPVLPPQGQVHTRQAGPCSPHQGPKTENHLGIKYDVITTSTSIILIALTQIYNAFLKKRILSKTKEKKRLDVL